MKTIYEYNILELIFWTTLVVVAFGALAKIYYISIICAMLYIGIFSFYYQKIYFSKKWIETKGVYKKYLIENIRLITTSYYSGYCYRPYCLYTYQVDGKTYTNDRLSILDKDFLEHQQFKDKAHDIIEKNSRTKEVTLYYNPKKPYESILVKGASFSKMIMLYSLLVIGLLSLGVGLYHFPCIEGIL